MPGMKAAVIHSFDGIERIAFENVPIPECKEDEVQIKVKNAAINPVDWKIAEGLLKSRMNYTFPIILGWDVAGYISQVGKNVTYFKEGDPVFAYCRKESLHDGSFAEYICLQEQNVVLKPRKLSFAEAAAIPLCALTAWQSLYEAAKIKTGDRILIHAGAGGVGSFAIQLAKMSDVYVLTTASAVNFEYVKNLGADEAIDYTKDNFVSFILHKYPQGLDAAFDTVGGLTLKQTYEVLKKGGNLVTIAGIVDQALATQHHLNAEYVFVRPDGKQLKQIADLYDAAKLKVPHIHEIPFEEAVSALRISRERHVQGKIVLKIS